jgi:membrane-associated protease RseP (regulator of RpoE activity)
MKTKLGINFINKLAKQKKFFRTLGYIGMIIGFLGMIAMFILISSSFVKLFTVPDAPSTVSPVIPGVRIPGSQIFVPFWYGIISLFIVIVVHEFGHGIIAKVHNLKIKNTGLVLFLILPGAFVEPDEEKLIEAKAKIQHSVYAAGPWFNVLLSLVAALILLFAISPAYDALANNQGITFTEVANNSPAMQVNLPVNLTYNKINEENISSIIDLEITLADKNPGDQMIFYTENNESYSLTLTNHPEDNSSPYIGILNIENVREKESFGKEILFNITDILASLFFWIYVLSLGIGAANLLPVGPLDGGRMLFTFLKSKFKEKTAKTISTNITILTVLFLLAALIIPIVRALI